MIEVQDRRYAGTEDLSKIDHPIPIKIGNDADVSGWDLQGGLKGAIAVPNENSAPASQIQDSVAIEICRQYVSEPLRTEYRGLKCAIAIADQNSETAVRSTGGQVKLAIAIKIG